MDYLTERFLHIFLFILSTFGILLLFGGILKLITNKFQESLVEVFGFFSWFIIYPFVTIHEFAHMITAFLFSQKIIEVKLLTFNKGRTLGYVSFTKVNSYSRLRMLYQNIGDFFIGFAPIILGTLLYTLLMKFLTPENFELAGELSKQSLNIFELLKNLFTKENIQYLLDFNLILFIISIFSISSLFSLSESDWKTSLRGLPYVLIPLVIITLLFGSFTWYQTILTSIIAFVNLQVLVLFYILFYSVIPFTTVIIISYLKTKKG